MRVKHFLTTLHYAKKMRAGCYVVCSCLFRIVIALSFLRTRWGLAHGLHQLWNLGWIKRSHRISTTALIRFCLAGCPRKRRNWPLIQWGLHFADTHVSQSSVIRFSSFPNFMTGLPRLIGSGSCGAGWGHLTLILAAGCIPSGLTGWGPGTGQARAGVGSGPGRARHGAVIT